MGNSQQSVSKLLYSNQKKYMSNKIKNQDQLNFYINVQDQHLGKVSIYKVKKDPLCYVLRLQQQLTNSSIYNTFKLIQNQQCSALISMYGFEINRMNCCETIVRQKIISYWQYYNYYLQDYIEVRLQNKTNLQISFNENQLWHIINICCQGFLIFEKMNIFFELIPQNLVITPIGKLKLFWIGNIQPYNAHLKYFKFFQKNYSLEHNFLYSPQEIILINLNQKTTKLDFNKCNVFRLGMILILCFTGINPIYWYSKDQLKVDIKGIQQAIAKANQKSQKSPQMIHLLYLMIQEKPKNRISMKQIYQQYGNLMNNSYQLMVLGNKKQSINHTQVLIFNDERKKKKQLLKINNRQEFLKNRNKLISRKSIVIQRQQSNQSKSKIQDFEDVKTVKMRNFTLKKI